VNFFLRNDSVENKSFETNTKSFIFVKLRYIKGSLTREEREWGKWQGGGDRWKAHS